MLKRNGESFASGLSRFRDHGDEPEPTSKVFVKLGFGNLSSTFLAQLDTGAAYSFLETQMADALGLLDGTGQQVTIGTRIGTFRGRLERVPITLVADEGEDLEVDAIFFVSREWPGKTFLGYSGLLSHIRIALDPSSNLFFFGGLG